MKWKIKIFCHSSDSFADKFTKYPILNLQILACIAGTICQSWHKDPCKKVDPGKESAVWERPAPVRTPLYQAPRQASRVTGFSWSGWSLALKTHPHTGNCISHLHLSAGYSPKLLEMFTSDAIQHLVILVVWKGEGGSNSSVCISIFSPPPLLTIVTSEQWTRMLNSFTFDHLPEIGCYCLKHESAPVHDFSFPFPHPHCAEQACRIAGPQLWHGIGSQWDEAWGKNWRSRRWREANSWFSHSHRPLWLLLHQQSQWCSQHKRPQQLGEPRTDIKCLSRHILVTGQGFMISKGENHYSLVQLFLRQLLLEELGVVVVLDPAMIFAWVTSNHPSIAWEAAPI